MTTTLSKPISSRSRLIAAAFEREALAIARRVVARGAAEPDHRVLLLRLELGAADEVGILVGLEVAHADDDRLRIERRGDAWRGRAPAGRRSIRSCRHSPRVSSRDLALGRLVLEAVVADERHRMDADVVADDELHPGEADAVGRDRHQRKAAAGLARLSITLVAWAAGRDTSSDVLLERRRCLHRRGPRRPRRRKP